MRARPLPKGWRVVGQDSDPPRSGKRCARTAIVPPASEDNDARFCSSVALRLVRLPRSAVEQVAALVADLERDAGPSAVHSRYADAEGFRELQAALVFDLAHVTEQDGSVLARLSRLLGSALDARRVPR